MGWRIEDVQGFTHLMNPEDRARYTQRLEPGGEPSPPPKTDRRERDEQRQFANWLLLQRSEGRRLPHYWAATHKRGTATPGIPDFGVGTFGGWIWLEFKRDFSSHITDAQKEFLADCEARGVRSFIVYSCAEAIDLVNQFDQLI